MTVEVIKEKQEKHLQSEKDIRWEDFFSNWDGVVEYRETDV